MNLTNKYNKESLIQHFRQMRKCIAKKDITVDNLSYTDKDKLLLESALIGTIKQMTLREISQNFRSEDIWLFGKNGDVYMLDDFDLFFKDENNETGILTEFYTLWFNEYEMRCATIYKTDSDKKVNVFYSNWSINEIKEKINIEELDEELKWLLT